MMPASVILATLSYLTVPLGIISTTVRINISCTGLEDTPEDVKSTGVRDNASVHVSINLNVCPADPNEYQSIINGIYENNCALISFVCCQR